MPCLFGKGSGSGYVYAVPLEREAMGSGTVSELYLPCDASVLDAARVVSLRRYRRQRERGAALGQLPSAAYLARKRILLDDCI